MTGRKKEGGVALLNVLMVMAISAALVQTMLASQETALSGARKAADRAQASALAKGGVASIRTGLARDLSTSPDSDHFNEAWAAAAQEEVEFEFGSYSVKVMDAQGLFDINGLSRTAVARQRVFSALLSALEMPTELGVQITEIVDRNGPLDRISQLRESGIPQRQINRLEPFVTTLPSIALINLNTAPEPVLSAIFGNAIVARSLIAKRDAQGFLTRPDLAELGVVQPVLAGWRSDIWDIRATAAVGDVTVSRHRRLVRNQETGHVSDIPRDQ